MVNWVKVSAFSGALAVAAGAFGAHGLKNKVDAKMLSAWSTAASYHLIHSVAMLALSAGSLPGVKTGSKGRSLALFATGTALFSGSLYALVLTNVSKIGAITPLGGLILIAGWLSIGVD